uniref:HAT C-terminal dimerisation domain-containing protein n=1 Tax=Sander lucioperca TaxID=283035 RepID=A0A8C9Y5M1_SANLU
MKRTYASGAEKLKKSFIQSTKSDSFFGPASVTPPETAAAEPPSQDASQNTDYPSSTQTAGSNDDQTLLVEQEHDDEDPTAETGEGDVREKAPFTETDPGCWPEHISHSQRFQNVGTTHSHTPGSSKSNTHRANMDSWRQLEKRVKTQWNDVMKRLIAVVCHLAEPNLAFRGHNSNLHETNNGNFLGVVELLAEFDPVMSEHVRRAETKEIADHYLGKTTQNELITLIGDKTVEAIIQGVKQSHYYSVIMDCTPDAAHIEQLSVTLCFVKCQIGAGATVGEHFVGFLPVLDTSGAGLTDVFLKHLEKLGLDVEKCRGQAYDNGSNMQGKNSGVQKRVLDINKKALFMPCASHSLNLVIVDAAKATVESVSFFGVLQRLYTIFSSSTQRWEIFKTNVPQMTLKAISNTETASAARGLEQEITSWKLLLTVIIWFNILHEVHRVSKLLQSPQVGIDVLQYEVGHVLKFLKEYRENGLSSAQTDARDIAEEMEMPMVFPTTRGRKPKRQFPYEPQNLDPSNSDTRGKVQERSTSEHFKLMETFHGLFGFISRREEMKRAVETYTLKESCANVEKPLGDVDAEDLVCEISAAVTAAPAKETAGLQILSYIYRNNLVELYPNLSIALRLMTTVPVTVASGERSFSRLKLIKTHLRSTMLQERLSALAQISIEHEVTKSLDKDELIRAFSALKHRRVDF